MVGEFTLKRSNLNLSYPPGGRPRLGARPLYCQFDYCPSCSFIVSLIFCFTASRLKLAGACIGG